MASRPENANAFSKNTKLVGVAADHSESNALRKNINVDKTGNNTEQ